MVAEVPILKTVFSGTKDFVGNLFNAPKAPDLKAPNALSSQPTQAEASKKAIDANLANEQAAASTSTILTGGQGALGDPMTTSKLLSGS